MSDESQQARARPVASFFPPEAPSFCSRLTPVVPASDDLRGFDGEFSADESGTRSMASPSSRPTVAPDELESLALISASRDPLPDDELMAEMMQMASVGPSVRPLDHQVLEAPLFVPVNPRRRGFARALFAVLFGGALALFGYAFQPRILAALHGATVAPSAR
jgi:hypothetical protein